MPIKRELRALYPAHWRDLSQKIRFERAGGRCQNCGRPHLVELHCLPDGRWFDDAQQTWRDRHGRCDRCGQDGQGDTPGRRGKSARWPDLFEIAHLRLTRVVLAAAHLDHDPTHNQLRNLRSLCQRCHLLHDQAHHLAQRRITYRRRRALGDLFLGPYAESGRR